MPRDLDDTREDQRRASRALRRALRAGDVLSLRAAIRAAESAGVSEILVSDARRELEENVVAPARCPTGRRWKPFAVFPACTFEGTRAATSFPLLAYRGMREDAGRLQRFEDTITAQLAGAPRDSLVVLEIGPGPYALLALMAVRAGARRVYAVEANPEAAVAARKCLRKHPLGSRIVVLDGYSTDVELPEPVDIVLGEILGSIASEEGVVATFRDARRFLRDPDRRDSWIPLRAQTFCAPVFFRHHGTSEQDERYQDNERMKEQMVVRAADVDPEVCLLASAKVVECFHFHRPSTLVDDWSRELEFHVEGPALLSGFTFFLGAEFADSPALECWDSTTWQHVIRLLGPAPIKLDSSRQVIRLKVRGELLCRPARYSLHVEIAAV